jgi:hypothetical protein
MAGRGRGCAGLRLLSLSPSGPECRPWRGFGSGAGLVPGAYAAGLGGGGALAGLVWDWGMRTQGVALGCLRSPLQGLFGIGGCVPRALPWATIGCPYRAWAAGMRPLRGRGSRGGRGLPAVASGTAGYCRAHPSACGEPLFRRRRVGAIPVNPPFGANPLESLLRAQPPCIPPW